MCIPCYAEVTPELNLAIAMQHMLHISIVMQLLKMSSPSPNCVSIQSYSFRSGFKRVCAMVLDHRLLLGNTITCVSVKKPHCLLCWL